MYQFHTRTKTARAPQLAHAAPEVWVEVSQRDARRLGIREGDVVEVSTPRGSITGVARICGIRDGVLFVPSITATGTSTATTVISGRATSSR